MDLYSGTERPLVQGTLRGYREWQWGNKNWLRGSRFPRGDFLWPQNLEWTFNAGDAPYQVSPWLPDTWNEAVCARLESHQVPYPDTECCGCGFYAKYRPQWNQISPSVAVRGIIEAKGRIILGTKGFRAQQARIVALIRPSDAPYAAPYLGLPHDQYKRLSGQVANSSVRAAEAYGVPLFNMEEALEAFPPHDVEELLPELKAQREREREKLLKAYMEIFREDGVTRFSGEWFQVTNM